MHILILCYNAGNGQIMYLQHLWLSSGPTTQQQNSDLICMLMQRIVMTVTWRPSIMANGTIAFDTLSTSGQITGTAKSVDTDYVVNGSAKSW